MPNPLKNTSATEPGLILPYSLSKARRMPSPVRFSPISTVKPSRLSSSATSRASLIGSLGGASASGYFALPITSAKRSPAANDGAVDDAEKSKVSSNTRRIFIITTVQLKKRRSKLAPRRPYSTQTALSNDPRRPSTACEVVINCDNSPRRAARMQGNNRVGRPWLGARFQVCPAGGPTSHNVTALTLVASSYLAA